MNRLAWVALFAALAAAPFFLGSYHNDVYRKLLLWITLALGYNFLFGICGQVAFSHFAFYGIGAYSVVILLFQLGTPHIRAQQTKVTAAQLLHQVQLFQQRQHHTHLALRHCIRVFLHG